MVMVGCAAPKLHCTALVGGKLRRLRWHDVHENKILVLVFDAGAARSREDLPRLSQASCRLRVLGSNLAVVCRPPLCPTRSWNEQVGALKFPLLLDPEDLLAWRYDLVAQDGKTLWGQFIIDPEGIVRQAEVCRCHIAAEARELIRFVRGLKNNLP